MKFSGIVGFYLGTKETDLDIYEPVIVEKPYKGDILRNSRSFQPVNNQANENLNINNQFSILSDLYMRNNLASIRYIIWQGVKWKVTNVSIDFPRVSLEIGGIYNAEQEET